MAHPLIGIRLTDLEHPRLVLHGPPGTGKTTVAKALAARAESHLMIAPQPPDTTTPGTALAELAAAANHPAPTTQFSPTPTPLEALALIQSLPQTLLIIDNAQWLDPLSANLLTYALRHANHLRVIAAERTTTHHNFPDRAKTLCGEHPTTFALRALPPDGTAELLAHYDISYRQAAKIHTMTAGNPAMTLTYAPALTPSLTPSLNPPLPPPLPPLLQHQITTRLSHLTDATRHTLRLAAFTDAPTLITLHRAGGTDLTEAEAADLTYTDDTGQVHFTAGAIKATIAATTPYPERLRLHAKLATAVDDPTLRTLHKAQSTDTKNTALATSAATAAAQARALGHRALAATLSLQAAHKTENEAEAVAHATQAAEDAGRAGLEDQTYTAATFVLSRTTDPALRVRARLSLIDVAGQALADAAEQFAHATADAGDDPALKATIRVLEAVQANLSDGDPTASHRRAQEAADLANQGDDPTTEARALTMIARTARIRGLPTTALAKALALPTHDIAVHDSPEYLAVRHDFFDDNLIQARTRLLALLPAAERSGAAVDVVDILRSLAEIEARAGNCAAALVHATRATTRTAEQALSPGPAWYTAALAEMAGGTFTRAVEYATRGATASEQEHDRVYLSRCLHALGTVHLITSNPDRATTSLTRVQELEEAQQVADPSILRWHADLAEALAATGNPTEATRLATRTRHTAETLNRPSVLAMLDRTQAILKADTHLLDLTATRFTTLGLPLEAGRTLLALASAQRRQRHRGAARTTLAAAIELFTTHRAHPWTALATAELHRLDPPTNGNLTPTETRLAELIKTGATNHQAAATLAVSVKTVEATLTRLYRKLGVHSRAQLAAQQSPHPHNPPTHTNPPPRQSPTTTQPASCHPRMARAQRTALE